MFGRYNTFESIILTTSMGIAYTSLYLLQFGLDVNEMDQVGDLHMIINSRNIQYNF